MFADKNLFGQQAIQDFFHYAAVALEVTGVLALLVGVATAIFVYLRHLRSKETRESFADFRANLGRGILVGLEFLVAADIVGTVAVAPTWNNVGVLATIIIIRTFLSIALEVEITGKFPWQSKGE